MRRTRGGIFQSTKDSYAKYNKMRFITFGLRYILIKQSAGYLNKTGNRRSVSVCHSLLQKRSVRPHHVTVRGGRIHIEAAHGPI